MFTKISLILSLLFISVGSHAFAQSYLVSSSPKNNEVLTHPLNAVPFIHAYIVPGTIGLLIIIGLASYWLLYRRKHTK